MFSSKTSLNMNLGEHLLKTLTPFPSSANHDALFVLVEEGPYEGGMYGIIHMFSDLHGAAAVDNTFVVCDGKERNLYQKVFGGIGLPDLGTTQHIIIFRRYLLRVELGCRGICPQICFSLETNSVQLLRRGLKNAWGMHGSGMPKV